MFLHECIFYVCVYGVYACMINVLIYMYTYIHLPMQTSIYIHVYIHSYI